MLLIVKCLIIKKSELWYCDCDQKVGGSDPTVMNMLFTYPPSSPGYPSPPTSWETNSWFTSANSWFTSVNSWFTSNLAAGFNVTSDQINTEISCSLFKFKWKHGMQAGSLIQMPNGTGQEIVSSGCKHPSSCLALHSSNAQREVEKCNTVRWNIPRPALDKHTSAYVTAAWRSV